MKTASGRIIPGGSAAIYRVAAWTLDEDGYTWTYTSAYADCGIPYRRLLSSAASLARYTAVHAVQGLEVQIDRNGKALFQDLPSGLYLVVQTQAAPDYLAFSPFLLTLPLYSETEGRYIYGVRAAPKTETIPVVTPPVPDRPTPKPPPVIPPSGDLPRTGQLWWPVPLLAACGLALLLLSQVLRKEERE